MLRFAIRRLISMVAVMFAISVLVFLIFFATPGADPASRLAGRTPDPRTVAAVRADLGLDKPLWVGYARMMDKLVVKRDLTSFVNRGTEVVPQVMRAAPVTLALVAGAAVIWVLASLLIGVLSARSRGGLLDPVLMVVSLIGVSIPAFWLGEVMNLLSQSRMHDTFLFSWVPPLGYTPLAENPGLWLRQMVIPWLTLSVLYVGLYARVLRNSLIEMEDRDFVRTARSKGISEGQVLRRHSLRMSLIAFVSLFGLDFGALVGGAALLVEVVFGLPGIGKLTYDSLKSLDLPVIMACVLYAAFFVVFVNAVVDLVHAKLDPQVRHG